MVWQLAYLEETITDAGGISGRQRKQRPRESGGSRALAFSAREGRQPRRTGEQRYTGIYGTLSPGNGREPFDPATARSRRMSWVVTRYRYTVHPNWR